MVILYKPIKFQATPKSLPATVSIARSDKIPFFCGKISFLFQNTLIPQYNCYRYFFVVYYSSAVLFFLTIENAVLRDQKQRKNRRTKW